MKKHFNKELLISKEDDKDFVNSTKCWICDHFYIESDVKLRDNCDIIVKYGASALRDGNTMINLNHKIPIVFHNLKNYDSHLIQKLDKFNFKMNIKPNVLEKYMNFNTNNK